MPEDATLQGWVPDISSELTLSKVIDLAFDYRGDVAIVKTDGSEITGFVFNRTTHTVLPFIQYFDEAGGGPFRLTYSEIAAIKFTGRDTALGTSWGAWQARKEHISGSHDTAEDR